VNKNTTLSIAISLALLGGTLTSIEAFAADKKDTAVTKPVKAEKPVAEKPVAEKPVKAEKPVIAEKPVKAEKPVAEKPVKAEKPVAEKPAKAEKPVAEKPVKAEKPAKTEKPVAENTAIDDGKVSKKPSKLDKAPKNNKKLANLGIDATELSDLGSFEIGNISEDAIGEFEAENFEVLSEEGASGLSKKQMEKADKEALKGLKGKHINAMPPETFEGMTGENLGGLEGDAIQSLNVEQLDAIPDEAIDELSEEEAAEMLANLGDEILLEGEDLEGDTSNKAKKIKRFLPPGWLIGKGNMLKRPPAAIIMMPVLMLPMHSSAALKVELTIANLNAGFGLGGTTGEDGVTALDGMNEIIADTGFVIEQTEEGILSVENSAGGELAFTPDADGMVQGPEGAEPGLGLNEEEQYVLTLEGGEQLPIDPAPKSFEELATNPDVTAVEIGEESEVTMEIQDEEGDDSSVIVGIFDPFVIDAPEGTESGVYITGEPGVDEQAVIVYEDGTQQVVNPSVQEPAEFEEVADNVPDVKSVIVNANGTVTVILEGNPEVRVTLTPALEVTPAEVSEEEISEEESTPTIDINDDGTITYTDSDGDAQDLYIGEVTPVDDTDAVDETVVDDTADDTVVDDTAV